MNIKNYKCIRCGSKNIKVVVNFGEFPIATIYSNYADEKVKKQLKVENLTGRVISIKEIIEGV